MQKVLFCDRDTLFFNLGNINALLDQLNWIASIIEQA